MKYTPTKSASSFWLNDEQIDRMYSGGGIDVIQYAAYKRAVSNFVRIVTKRTDIKVNFSSGKNSYTDGKTIVISSKINDPSKFDSIVGLALHEGSHIVLTDMVSYRKKIESLQSAGYSTSALQMFKSLFNIIEDRRIDRFIYDSAPGYRAYYEALYREYFYHPAIDAALKLKKKSEVTRDNYLFHITNFINPNRDLKALPRLREIWDLIDLRNIDRLKSSDEVADLALKVYEIIEAVMANQTLPGQHKPKSKSAAQQPNESDCDSKSTAGSDSEDDSSDDDIDENLDTPDPDVDDEDEHEHTPEDSDEDDSDEVSTEPDVPKTPAEMREQRRLENDLKKLAAAEQQQQDFMDGKIKKSKVTATESNQIDTLADSNTELKVVGEGGDYINPSKKIKAFVVRGFTQELMSIFSGYVNQKITSKTFSKYRYGRGPGDYIADGFNLGTMLGNRLKTRDEQRSLETIRLKSGKLSGRLVAGLGYGNENVFGQILHYQVTPSLIHISIDASGSMCGTSWENAMKTAIAIAKAASMISSIECTMSLRGRYQSGKDVYPLSWEFYDSRKMNINSIREKLYSLHPAGSTPEGLCFESIREDLIKDAAGKDAYFINLSDGVPCFDGKLGTIRYDYGGTKALLHTQKQINKLRNSGINVLSFFIDEDGRGVYLNDFKVMYGDSATSIDTSKLNNLAVSLNKMFERKYE